MATRMRTFIVRVAIAPPMVNVVLLGETVTYEDRKIRGVNLADAMKRAGIS